MNHVTDMVKKTAEFVEFECPICGFRRRIFYAGGYETLDGGDESAFHSGSTEPLDISGVTVVGDELDEELWAMAFE